MGVAGISTNLANIGLSCCNVVSQKRALVLGHVPCHEKFGPGVKSGPAGPILVGQNWSAPAKTGPICARMKLRLVIAAALQSRQLWTARMWEISLLRYTNTLYRRKVSKN